MSSPLPILLEKPPLETTLASFVREYWERDMAVLPGVTPGAFASEEELFHALVETGRHVADDEANQYVVWVGGQLQKEPGAFAARTEDGSLPGYISRLTTLAGEREFTVLLPNPHRYDCVVRRRVREFTSVLAKYSGIPCGGFDTGIFLGRYGKTPFGVHRGQMSVLTFPVTGTKRFLLWPYEYGEEHVAIHDSLSYDDHLQACRVLTARPGDIGYWPANYWHIADGPVAVSAALNIGLWWDRPALDLTLTSFAESLSDAEGAESDPRECFDVAGVGQGGALEQAFDRIVRVAQSPATRAQIELRWLAVLSASGMRDPFPTRLIGSDEIRGEICVRLMPGEEIRAAPLSTGQLGVALLGHTIVVDARAGVAEDVARLNSGRGLRLELAVPQMSRVQNDRADFHALLAQSLACELYSPAPDEDVVCT